MGFAFFNYGPLFTQKEKTFFFKNLGSQKEIKNVGEVFFPSK